MSKILIFADLHVHPHKRSSDRLKNCLDVLKWIFDTALSRGIEDIVCAGDLFHDRQKIDVLTYQLTFDMFQKYVDKDKLRVTLLLGNHDLWHHQKWDVSSVRPLSAISGVTVIGEPSTHMIQEKEFAFLPYTHNPLNDLQKIKSKTSNRILFGHVAIDGAKLNVMHGVKAKVRLDAETVEHDGDMQVVDCSVFRGWDQVFLGHYHAEQKLDYNVEYIGSPLQLSFGEAFQHKHLIVFDVEDHSKEYIRNTFSPQHFIIPEAELDKYPLDGNFIRVIVEDIASSDLVEMRNDLVKNHKVASLDIKSADKKVDDTVVDDAKSILIKEDSMLETYLQDDGVLESIKKHFPEVDLENDRKSLEKKLLEVGKKICEGIKDE